MSQTFSQVRQPKRNTSEVPVRVDGTGHNALDPPATIFRLSAARRVLAAMLLLESYEVDAARRLLLIFVRAVGEPMLGHDGSTTTAF
jgi:hypothetical protein